MSENLKELKKGLFHGLGILIILFVGGGIIYLIKARTTTDPGLGDNGSSLYTEVNGTLTAAKRNALVNQTFTKKTNTISCYISGSSSVNTQIMQNWDSTVCGGVSKLPNQYDNCISGISYINSSNPNIYYCDKNYGKLNSGTSNYRLLCNFICRDD